MWQHSCSFSLGRQVNFAATEVYFISSALSHFICHPPSFFSDDALLQTFPSNYPFHLLPFTPCALLSVFSFLLHLHWYHPAVFSSTSHSFDHHSLQMLPNFTPSSPTAASARNTLTGSAQKHTARPQKPSSKMASPQKYFSNEKQTSSVTLSVHTSVDATCVKHVKIARKI